MPVLKALIRKYLPFLGVFLFYFSPNYTAAESLFFTVNDVGDSDYARQLTIPTGFGEGEFTLELWIKPDNNFIIGPRDSQFAILNYWLTSDTDRYDIPSWWYDGNFLLDGHNNSSFGAGTFSLQFYGGGRVRWTFGDGASPPEGAIWGVQSQPTGAAPSLIDGNWHQITCVRRWNTSNPNSADLELWIDGQLVNTETSSARTNMRQWWDSWTSFPSEQFGWFWGAEKQAAVRTNFPYEDFKGLLDEIRFWSRAKSPSEISSGWNQSVNGDETGLVGLFRFSEGGTATTTCDQLDATNCMTLHNMKTGYWNSEEAPTDGGGGGGGGGNPPPDSPKNLRQTN